MSPPVLHLSPHSVRKSSSPIVRASHQVHFRHRPLWVFTRHPNALHPWRLTRWGFKKMSKMPTNGRSSFQISACPSRGGYVLNPKRSKKGQKHTRFLFQKNKEKVSTALSHVAGLWEVGVGRSPSPPSRRTGRRPCAEGPALSHPPWRP